jgi:hypothetical protein
MPYGKDGKSLSRPQLDDWTKHVLTTVRCDLAWAFLRYGRPESGWRFKSGIKMITDLLGDDSEWEKLKQRWEKEDPGTIARLYDPPPDPNPAP